MMILKTRVLVETQMLIHFIISFGNIAWREHLDIYAFLNIVASNESRVSNGECRCF
jgi:hypothetical protein